MDNERKRKNKPRTLQDNLQTGFRIVGGALILGGAGAVVCKIAGDMTSNPDNAIVTPVDARIPTLQVLTEIPDAVITQNSTETQISNNSDDLNRELVRNADDEAILTLDQPYVSMIIRINRPLVGDFYAALLSKPVMLVEGNGSRIKLEHYGIVTNVDCLYDYLSLGKREGLSSLGPEIKRNIAGTVWAPMLRANSLGASMILQSFDNTPAILQLNTIKPNETDSLSCPHESMFDGLPGSKDFGRFIGTQVLDFLEGLGEGFQIAPTLSE